MKNRKIKIIMLMLAFALLAAATQAQSESGMGWLDDWKELQTAPARSIARHNPSAVCELDWIPAPGWTPALSYDVCIVAGFHEPEILWLAISASPVDYVGRDLWIIWLKDDAPYYDPIRHHQSGATLVIKVGGAEQVPRDFDTFAIFDIDSASLIQLDLAHFAALNKYRHDLGIQLTAQAQDD